MTHDKHGRIAHRAAASRRSRPRVHDLSISEEDTEEEKERPGAAEALMQPSLSSRRLIMVSLDFSLSCKKIRRG
jgi:hypothetical protein